MSEDNTNPPKRTQSTSSGSSKPRGRPRKLSSPISEAVAFRKLVLQRVPFEVRGKMRKISRLEAVVRQVEAMSHDGSLGATRLLFRIGQRFSPDEPSGDATMH